MCVLCLTNVYERVRGRERVGGEGERERERERERGRGRGREREIRNFDTNLLGPAFIQKVQKDPQTRLLTAVLTNNNVQ